MTTLTPPPAATRTAEGDPLLAVACPACHAALAAARAAAGTTARCPVCRVAFLLPTPAPHEPSARDRMIDGATAADGADPRRRDREEKARRRARRNLLMLFTGGTILLAIVLLFGTRRPKKQR